MDHWQTNIGVKDHSLTMSPLETLKHWLNLVYLTSHSILPAHTEQISSLVGEDEEVIKYSSPPLMLIGTHTPSAKQSCAC